jgi:hypothetical protein
MWFDARSEHQDDWGLYLEAKPSEHGEFEEGHVLCSPDCRRIAMVTGVAGQRVYFEELEGWRFVIAWLVFRPLMLIQGWFA